MHDRRAGGAAAKGISGLSRVHGVDRRVVLTGAAATALAVLCSGSAAAEPGLRRVIVVDGWVLLETDPPSLARADAVS